MYPTLYRFRINKIIIVIHLAVVLLLWLIGVYTNTPHSPVTVTGTPIHLLIYTVI